MRNDESAFMLEVVRASVVALLTTLLILFGHNLGRHNAYRYVVDEGFACWSDKDQTDIKPCIETE